MNTFALYTVIRVSGSFVDASNGNPVDPTTVTIILTDPSGVATTVSVGIVRDSVGAYHYDWTPQMAGVWTIRYQGSGAIVTANVPVSVYLV